MRCRCFRKRIFEYLDGALPADEAEAARRHLAECASCAGELTREQDLGARIRRSVARAATGLHVRPAGPARPPSTRRRGAPAFTAWAAAVAVVLLFTAVLALRLSFPEARPGPAATGGTGGGFSRAVPATGAPPGVTQVITLEDDLGLVNEVHFITEEPDGSGTHIVARMGGGPETEIKPIQGGWK